MSEGAVAAVVAVDGDASVVVGSTYAFATSEQERDTWVGSVELLNILTAVVALAMANTAARIANLLCLGRDIILKVKTGILQSVASEGKSDLKERRLLTPEGRKEHLVVDSPL